MGCTKTTTFPVLLLFWAAMLSGCATTIKTTVLSPAKAHKAARLRRVAVLPFAGPRGEQVSGDVEALLVGIRLKGEPYFQVIERAHIKKIVDEYELAMTGLVDEETAVEVGKLAGAEAIVLGTVTQNLTEDNRFTEKRSKCQKKDEDGNCVKWREYTVGCTKRNAYFSFAPKIVNVATGEIAASESLAGRSEDKVCQDSGRPLRGAVEMLAAAETQALDKLRELVAPYYVTVEITLLEKDDTKPPPEAKEKIKQGIEWAKDGRMDRACEYWRESYDIHPEGYAIQYLLGVCAETEGNLHEALSCYEKADRMTGKPVKEITEALGRVQVSMEKQRRLEEQLDRR